MREIIDLLIRQMPNFVKRMYFMIDLNSSLKPPDVVLTPTEEDEPSEM